MRLAPSQPHAVSATISALIGAGSNTDLDEGVALLRGAIDPDLLEPFFALVPAADVRAEAATLLSPHPRAPSDPAPHLPVTVRAGPGLAHRRIESSCCSPAGRRTCGRRSRNRRSTRSAAFWASTLDDARVRAPRQRSGAARSASARSSSPTWSRPPRPRVDSVTIGHRHGSACTTASCVTRPQRTSAWR